MERVSVATRRGSAALQASIGVLMPLVVHLVVGCSNSAPQQASDPDAGGGGGTSEPSGGAGEQSADEEQSTDAAAPDATTPDGSTVSGMPRFQALRSCGSAVCAEPLTSSRQVWAWGRVRGLSGVLPSAPSQSPAALLPAGVTVFASDGSGNHCWLEGPTVTCAGYQYGQAGAGPRTVSGVTQVEQLSVGSLADCALRTGGLVTCWKGLDGPLTRLPQDTDSIPGEAITALRRGGAGREAFVITQSGAVYGLNSRSWTKVALASAATDVASGLTLACALLSSAEGTVQCWSLGSPTPATVSTADGLPLKGVRRIAVGQAFACAAKESGDVACWGSNEAGQLGNNTTTSSATPVAVAGVNAKAGLAAAAAFACALGSDGSVKCWGSTMLSLPPGVP